nr:polymer-forming cytoskeletal protein [Halomonas sp. MCCC 1A11057]
MTLIVWDGGRRKRQRLATGLPPSAAPEAVAARAHPLPVEPIVETASVDTPPAARLPNVPEGSRIGLATHVSGNLVAREPVVVKGSIEGAVIAQDHSVMVTMSGRVSSYLEGRKVSVDGQVAGMVKAGDKITLLSRARVEGSLHSRRLECIAGARIRGKVASVEPLGGIPMVAGTKTEPGLP